MIHEELVPAGVHCARSDASIVAGVMVALTWSEAKPGRSFTYSMRSHSPPAGHVALSPRVQKLGHSPQPYGVCENLRAARKVDAFAFEYSLTDLRL